MTSTIEQARQELRLADELLRRAAREMDRLDETLSWEDEYAQVRRIIASAQARDARTKVNKAAKALGLIVKALEVQ